LADAEREVARLAREVTWNELWSTVKDWKIHGSKESATAQDTFLIGVAE
jgi:hypothetical protein